MFSNKLIQITDSLYLFSPNKLFGREVVVCFWFWDELLLCHVSLCFDDIGKKRFVVGIL